MRRFKTKEEFENDLDVYLENDHVVHKYKKGYDSTLSWIYYGQLPYYAKLTGGDSPASWMTIYDERLTPLNLVLNKGKVNIPPNFTEQFDNIEDMKRGLTYLQHDAVLCLYKKLDMWFDLHRVPANYLRTRGINIRLFRNASEAWNHIEVVENKPTIRMVEK